MRTIAAIILIILFYVPGCLCGEVILELAGGVGSNHMPYSSDWDGRVKAGALDYREFASRVTFNLEKYLSFSMTAGWFKDREMPDRMIFVPLCDMVSSNFG